MSVQIGFVTDSQKVLSHCGYNKKDERNPLVKFMKKGVRVKRYPCGAVKPCPMSILTITQENFEREVLQADKPVLLDFWAPWCGPCRMLSPVIDEIAEEMDVIRVGKVNVDENPELAGQFGVQSIPMLALVKDGQVVDTSVGVRPKADIVKMVEAQCDLI